MPGQPNNLEIEVKFHLESPDAIRQKLLAAATVLEPKVFETNLRYENDAHTLLKQGQLLRLRRDRGSYLTFKSKSDQQQKQFKIHHELEVSVSDFHTMDAMLQQLGFKVAQIYEKWRETFAYGRTLVCLDTMPYGHFLEIEGSRHGIQTAAGQLGLAWDARILENYLSIFEILRQKAGLPFTDVTFDNFKRHPVDIAQYLDLLQRGSR